jgi:hypothetical protein
VLLLKLREQGPFGMGVGIDVEIDQLKSSARFKSNSDSSEDVSLP